MVQIINDLKVVEEFDPVSSSPKPKQENKDVF